MEPELDADPEDAVVLLSSAVPETVDGDEDLSLSEAQRTAMLAEATAHADLAGPSDSSRDRAAMEAWGRILGA